MKGVVSEGCVIPRNRGMTRSEGLAALLQGQTMTSFFDRRISRRAFAALAPLGLAGCVGSGTLLPPGLVGGEAPPPETPVAPMSGSVVGTGSVRVALILPLSGPGQGAVAAQSMRNAAELALGEFQDPDITLIVKDDRGTPEGARDAASQAIAEGAELIIGPLFAGSVQAAASVARQSGVPVVAFSTDAGVASRGVYLLSFLPQEEVDRIVDYAASRGKRSVAMLIPETTYGSVVEARFSEAAAARGLRIAALERYPGGQPQAAVGRLRMVIGGASPQADAIFIPESAEGLPAVDQALQSAGFDPRRVKPLGTGVWNEPRAFSLQSLQGSWFASPDSRGFEAFAARYRARYNSEPVRLATLSFDAVSLAAALVRTQGSQRFTEGVLTNPAGFAGADGVFRFRSDGTSDRALAVHEIRNGTLATVSAAPRTLPAPGF
jgi:ABC-type branched-subunit amino acid transport system substrate-binding protein